MVDRIRNEFNRVMTGEADGGRMSQAELDAYRRQLMLLAVSVTAALLILILGIGAYYQYVHLPRQSVATVNGDTIRRADYWDFRRYELLNQINQYQQFAQFMEGDQANQYLQLAFDANQEFEGVENASIDPMTVDQMINNKILMDALDDFGIEITDQEVEDHLVRFFTGMSISDEPAGPSADPTAEAWATATAEAQQAEMEEAEAEAEIELDPQAAEENDDAATDDDAENGDEQVPDDNGENGAGDDAEEPFDDAEEMPTPEPEPTPSEAEMRATAEATQQDHQTFLLDRAGISHDEFVEMFIKPDIARERIRARLAEDVATRGEHVEAAHILVATQDAAQVIYEDLTENDADFAEVAMEQSTDTQTAPNGGDLGWFPRGVMVEEFDDVIFDLEVGEISEPFNTDFGWHIATVTDRDDDRPLELSTLEQLRQRAFQDWMEQQREAAEIETDYDVPETEAPPQDQFQPPAGAPQPPQPVPDLDVQAPQEIPIGEPEMDDIFEGEDPFENIEDDS